MEAQNPRRVVAALVRQIRAGEGVRVGALATTRYGKSTFLAHLASEVIASGAVDWALIVESGDLYPGERYASVAEMLGRPPRGRVVVFEGDDFAGVPVNVIEVAHLAWRLAQRGSRVLFVCDELPDATKGGKQWADARGPIPRLFSKGGKHGLSVFWSCQIPQMAPTLALTQTDFLFAGAMDAIAAGNLLRNGKVSREQAESLVSWNAAANPLSPRRLVGRFLFPPSGDVFAL